MDPACTGVSIRALKPHDVFFAVGCDMCILVDQVCLSNVVPIKSINISS